MGKGRRLFSKFPTSVKVLVGPGIMDKYAPGWPENPIAEFKQSDIAGHEFVELLRTQFNINVGGMGGYDYFGDGSLYLLDAPRVS
jgi:hypothetical protein